MNTQDRIDLFRETRAATEIPPDAFSWLVDHGFFTAPASTKYHGAYEGGLFDHSYEVMKALVELTEKNGLVWKLERSPYIVGIFHDLCKIDLYRHPPWCVTLSVRRWNTRPVWSRWKLYTGLLLSPL